MSLRNESDIRLGPLSVWKPLQSWTMRASHRISLAASAAVVLLACLGVSWHLLPVPHACIGPFVRVHCDSGAVNVFGAGLFTLAQTLVMAVGIWAAALLWSRAIVPSLLGTSLGLGVAALALVIAITLPRPSSARRRAPRARHQGRTVRLVEPALRVLLLRTADQLIADSLSSWA
jgi:hypothetical protein